MNSIDNIDLLKTYQGRKGVYKEQRCFFLVLVKEVELFKEKDLLFFNLKIIEKAYATFDNKQEFVFYEFIPTQ